MPTTVKGAAFDAYRSSHDRHVAAVVPSPEPVPEHRDRVSARWIDRHVAGSEKPPGHGSHTQFLVDVARCRPQKSSHHGCAVVHARPHRRDLPMTEVNTRWSRRQFAEHRESQAPTLPGTGATVETCTSVPGSRTGRSRSTRALSRLKMAAFAPIARASVTTTTSANPGVRR